MKLALYSLKRDDRELPEEREYVAGAITGLWESNPWQGEKKPVDFFVVKGIIEAVFEALGVFECRISQSNRLQWTCTQVVQQKYCLNGEVIGFIGQVHPSIQKDYDVKETYVFELSLRR